jgi:hypothetical protein
MWWVPHAKRHVPMRPTWGNGGLTVGNSGGGGGRLFPLGERNATLRSNNTLSFVALDGRRVPPTLLLALLETQRFAAATRSALSHSTAGEYPPLYCLPYSYKRTHTDAALRCRLYERGFSSQEWMHPDRCAPLSY